MFILIFLVASFVSSFATDLAKIPFATDEIISKISCYPHHNNPIILGGKAYFIEFKESGLFLKAVNSLDKAEDIFIPIDGCFAINGNRVSYRTEEGTITFQGLIRNHQAKLKTNSLSPDEAILPNLNESDNKSVVTTDLFTTGEFLIDTSIIPIPAPGQQGNPAVAFDGTNFFVVWEDRNNFSDIYGARVNQFGVVIDSVAIPISVAPGYQIYPAVAFDGTNFLVVWQDWRRGLYADIYGARVSTTGEVIDPIEYGILISNAVDDQWFPKVAFDGTNYLVVWQDFRNHSNFDIYGTRVSPAGAVLDPSGIAISTAGDNEYAPCVAFGGSNYMVLWTARTSSDNTDILGTRIDVSGNVLDPTGLVISNASGYQYSSSITFDGTNYFGVWEDYRNNDTSNIYGARINQAGTVLDLSGIPISTAVSEQWEPGVCFNGADYQVVWEDYRNGSASDIYGARVSLTGTVLDPSGIAICIAGDYQYSSAVGSNGLNGFVFWQDFRSGSDIYLARINQSGTVLDPNGTLISYAANDQYYPKVAFDGTNYLVVWTDWRGGDYSDIYGALVNQSGATITPPIAISTAPNNQKSPAVVFGGNNYFVVWEDYRNNDAADIYGARVTTAGVVLDPNGILINSAQDNQLTPKVAFDGDNYFVIWADFRATKAERSDIYGSLVTQAGLVINPAGILLPRLSESATNPAIVFGGNNYLVVWQDDFEMDTYDNLFAVRVNKFGIVIDTEDIVVSDKNRKQFTPSVCFDGVNYFVVWADNRNGLYTNTDIYGCRITQDGINLDRDGIPITTETYGQVAPCVTFDGTNYLVIWQDYRSGRYTDLYGAKVNLAGSIVTRFPISIEKGNQNAPAMANSFGNQILITYSGWTGALQNKKFNSMRIWGKYYAGLEPVPEFGWSRKGDVSGATKRVKDGGCLTTLNHKVYALVGNNTQDLMVYDINTNSWAKESDVPFSSLGGAKRVKKGAGITNDGYYLYVVKGNNTQEFYRYDPYSKQWQELPKPNFSKRIKGGSMTFDGTRYIYLISGANRNEWKAFDVYADTWIFPIQVTLPADKWKYGSSIVYLKENIYALRVGGKTNEFYKLDFYTREWTRLPDMPLYSSNGSKKKAKKGSCLATDGNYIYALKGGNTFDFYRFNPKNDSWDQKEDVGQPTGIPAKRVKGGGALTYSKTLGGFFALIGNNTNEFWFYLPNPNLTDKSEEGVMAKTGMANGFNLLVNPNPAKQTVNIKYNLPNTVAKIKLYDVLGKLVYSATTDNEIHTINVSKFSSGIYLLRIDAENKSATKKILVAN